MLDRNFGGRRVQIVGGYKRLDELSTLLKPFAGLDVLISFKRSSEAS